MTSNKRRANAPQPRRRVPRGRPASKGATFWRLEGVARPLGTRRPLGAGGPNLSSAGSWEEAPRQWKRMARCQPTPVKVGWALTLSALGTWLALPRY